MRDKPTIYKTIIKFDKDFLFKLVSAETTNKVYNPNELRKDGEAISRNEYAIVDDERFWFDNYLDEAGAEIAKILNRINKTDEPTYYIYDEREEDLDDGGYGDGEEHTITIPPQIEFIFTICETYDLTKLEKPLKNALVNYIVSRWYLMKNRIDLQTIYAQMHQGNMDTLNSIGVRGWEGTLPNAVGEGASVLRTYDVGLRTGINVPNYEISEEIVVVHNSIWRRRTPIWTDKEIWLND